MLKTFAGAVGVTLGVALVAGAADAAVQMPATAAMLRADNGVQTVSFWAQSYPHHYVPWRRCPRVRVETPYGWYWDRVCVAPGTTVLRRAY